RNEHFLPSPGNPVEAVGVAPGEIAGAQPAVLRERGAGRLVVAPVTGRHAGAGKLQVADRIVRQLAVMLVDDAGAAQELRPADRADPRPGVGGIDKEGGWPRLGHAHAVADAVAEIAVSESERVRQRRTAAAPVADMVE